MKILSTHILFRDTRSAWLWFFVRLYVGWVWLEAALEKIGNDAWTGGHAGAAIVGFVKGSLLKTGGAHPDVTKWYAWFLNHAVLPYPVAWSYAISFGELFVAAGLILGICTGAAALFGIFMNLNFLFAGTVSVNPQLLILSIGILSARRIAGRIGIGRFLRRRRHRQEEVHTSV